MVAKTKYIQSKEDSELAKEYDKEYLIKLDRTLYGNENPQEIFECATYRINPNFWYVLGNDKNDRKVFDTYLKSHNIELSHLFLLARTEKSPEFMLQDYPIKALLFQKFHNNPDYGIFDVEHGKIKIRRMNNKEAIHKLEKFVDDMHRVNGTNYSDRLDIIKIKVEQLKKNLQCLIDEKIHLENLLPFDQGYVSAEEQLKELRKKILFRPLWIQ